MKVSLYLDEDSMARSLVAALRARGADVQTELQQMGYYQGEVDGLLGPMTRQALTAYQADQGLTTTAVIDQPTLDSLGMSS